VIDFLRPIDSQIEIFAKITERLVILQHMVDGNQHAMCHGNGGTVGTTANDDSLVLCAEVALALGRNFRTLHQSGFQCACHVPVNCPAAPTFSSAFIVAWGEPRPAGDVTRRREPRHVEPRLNEDGLGAPPGDAWNLIEFGNGFFVGLQIFAEHIIHLADALRHVIDMVDNLADERFLHGGEEAVHCLHDGIYLRLQSPVNQLADTFLCERIVLSCAQGRS